MYVGVCELVLMFARSQAQHMLWSAGCSATTCH